MQLINYNNLIDDLNNYKYNNVLTNYNTITDIIKIIDANIVIKQSILSRVNKQIKKAVDKIYYEP